MRIRPLKSKQKLHIPSSWSTTASAALSFSLTVAAIIFWQGLREVHGSQHPPWRHRAFTWVMYIPSASLRPGAVQALLLDVCTEGECAPSCSTGLQLGPGTTAGGSGTDRKQLRKGIVALEAFIPSDAKRHQAEVPSIPPEVTGIWWSRWVGAVMFTPLAPAPGTKITVTAHWTWGMVWAQCHWEQTHPPDLSGTEKKQRRGWAVLLALG